MRPKSHTVTDYRFTFPDKNWKTTGFHCVTANGIGFRVAVPGNVSDFSVAI